MFKLYILTLPVPMVPDLNKIETDWVDNIFNKKL